ncbi:UDP-N-acetylmuramoyl-L-alanine--D-glutamate ligase [uncultured Jatrophihabitans sp.]|uniref:UDP-N-acetylmuramoyl-L-alanine--D-glutamate ligase n=1 Tax=uncultured Jatrophihabitans sp. TaxID=1610747 RepID=UPI0035CA7406
MAEQHAAPALPLAPGIRVLVCGVGVAGTSAARALLELGAVVTLTATRRSAGVDELERLGAHWADPLETVPDDIDFVVASPGVPPHDPLLREADARPLPVFGEAELAWYLRPEQPAPWLALTGTNGKTTTVHMLESILQAAGLRALAVGNVGTPLIDAVRELPPYDVLAVELSSQQLQFAPSVAPAAGALLNIAPDHLNWHGSMAAYERAKRHVLDADVAIVNADDPRVVELAPDGAIGFTLGAPDDGQLGVVGGALVSRAFGDHDAVLARVDDVRPAGAHNVANALAAAALARAHGVAPAAIAAGLAAFTPDPHRNAFVATVDGIDWVDDSKATNPHAAHASLSAYPRIVWVAGGQLKGVDVADLVREATPRLAGAVLLGADRALVAAALARHAPDVPVIMVDSTDDGAMTEVVHAAAGLARPGDTVLLAPAAASYDMFSGFGARGDAFAAAVHALADR